MPGKRSLSGRLIVAALVAVTAILLRLALWLLPTPNAPILTLCPDVLFAVAGVVVSHLAWRLYHAKAAADVRAERLEAMLAGAPVGFAVCDRRHQIVRLNAALAELCSSQSSGLIGQPVEAVLPAGSASPGDLLEQVFRSGKALGTREWVGRLALGEERTWLLSLFPICAAIRTDEVEQVGLIAQDVSQLANALSDLHRQANELSENERRKDVFLAMLSHELRNPLAALRSATDLLILGEPARGEVLTLFRRQLGLLTRLVDDLLDVARVSRGQIELRRHTVALPDVIEAALETSRPALDERRHFVETILPPRQVMVRGDAARLTQAVSNLLVNAARYTPPGGSVSIRLDVEGGDAVLRVTDTGMGIPAEMLGRIFELFHQGEPPPGQPREGLGLGLTLVRRLVELHGGSVSATSPGAGLGSTFEIRLPVLPMTTTPSPHPPSNTVRPPSQRVLVVDDNADAAESLSLLLQVQGHEVKVVHDGPAAVDEVAAWKPHVVFLDVGLPGMDGFEVVKELRERHGESAPRLIALTGFGHEEDRQKGLEAGFDEFLVKPAGPEDLCRAIAGEGRPE